MFGNKLAILSLLLVGLSLSSLSHLSEAARRDQLFQVIRQSADHDELKSTFQLLGRHFMKYAQLTEITLNNCTPDRILFRNTMNNFLGEGSREYVRYFVNRQREICEMTFYDRLLRKYGAYLDDWEGKECFQQYVNFIIPWPTFGMDWNAFKESVRNNIEAYIEWRETQRPRPLNRYHVMHWIIQSNRYVYYLLSGFYASMRANENFQPVLSFEHAHAVALGMIAEATRSLIDHSGS